jgi:hypothetical protein
VHDDPNIYWEYLVISKRNYILQSDSEYTAYIEQLIGMLAQNHALGRDIDIAMCVSGLEPNRHENRKVRDFVTRGLKMNGRDFDRALHLETIRAELGTLPKTSRQFVEAFVATKRITARYNGVLRMDEIPYLSKPDGTREFIDPALWDSYEFKTMIRTNFKRTIGFSELQQALRVRAAELRLDFTPAMLNDASELWYADACRGRLWHIRGEIDYSDSVEVRERGQADLKRVVETCFECQDGVDFIVALFIKFIWQVKRKIEDLPIYDHLMPVILGSQGVGKSTFVRKLLQPIDELWVMTDFSQITDIRNITLWLNFVLFLDEMGNASKSNLATIKNVTSATTLTRRTMFTNSTQQIVQNATFIGTTNALSLGEEITDSSGARRFAAIHFKEHSNRDIINNVNWHSVWQSVNPTAPDPMIPFRAVLRKQQEAERLKTPLEDWLIHLDPHASFGKLPNGRRFRSADLHTVFREFEDLRNPGLIKTSLASFVRQMKHLATREDAKFKFVEDGGYILWEIV